ncbi:hypothetical protein SAMN04488515_0322 [Cognatiyoonia koreensis]|uniref:Transferrin-binding protein B C-lobe/N-lobe beta-barrel domain-containing protein n=1 Tax=Cognatiyoonia koreensis TaxID=364200 RepID=A0A1I0MZB9_9RHOB|nr:transferrin-binding protein-like solute binding protein [Cognatiyoonia koreensis]SEV93992.1 hypothetical protein SAMN04488515_0322 [Cognatiyoonia koreensis]
MRYSASFALPCFVLLSACGGSSGQGFDTRPISAAGFATADTEIAGDYDYTLTNPQRIRITSDQTATQERTGDITLSGTVGEGPVTLTIDGETYTLERSPTNRTTYEVDDDFINLFTALPVGENVVALRVFAAVDGDFNLGGFVAGYDTNPAEVGARDGTAIYFGRSDLTLRRGFDDAFGQGTINLIVDFDDASVSGGGIIRDDELGVADFNFQDLTVSFDDAEINENGFEGTFVLSFDGGVIETNDTIYEGRFFGPNAAEVGGQFHGSIVEPLEDQDTLIDGIFVAAE